MERYIIYATIVLATLGIHVLILRFFRKNKNKTILEDAQKEAREILRTAKLNSEATKKEKMLQAKERFIELKSNHEREVNQREKKILERESSLKQKESQVHKEIKNNSNLKRKLEHKQEVFNQKLEKIEKRE